VWTYSQSTGHLLDATGALLCLAYSGTGDGRNNPAMENVPDVGPIPQGTYTIGPEHLSPHTGPVSMCLTPLAGTDTLGRSEFLIHGDNAEHDASHGCVIVDHDSRLKIAASEDRELKVIA